MIYVTKVILLGLHFFLTSVLGFFFSLLRPFHPNNSYYVGNWLGKIGLAILSIDLEVENEHYLNARETKIIISNHQSNYDVLFCSSLCPERTVSIGKKSILFFPFFGLLFWITGNVMIDRKNKRKALNAMSSAEKAITERNTSIWIMPEGTRSKGRGLLPFKKGAFICAHNTGRPLIPVCIEDYSKKIDLNSFKKVKIKVKVLPPILQTNLKSAAELSNLAYEQMKKEIVSLK
jgi:1-acyl-sn-glycerol-3-phosphate acyltransferase